MLAPLNALAKKSETHRCSDRRRGELHDIRPRRYWAPMRRLLLVVLASLLAVAAGANVALAGDHPVRQGQTLSAIARRYHITVGALASANGLAETARLRVGQVLQIPEQGVVFVRDGQTLSHIARRHGVSIRDLARANRLRDDATLRVGQRLTLPGYERSGASERAARRWGTPRHRGIVSLYRPVKQEQLRMRLLDQNGRARTAARRQLSHMMRHRTTLRSLLPNPRLLWILTQVSDHFGGRRIYVMSGYRPAGGYTRETSRHTKGRALDIRVQGVPNTELRDYLRTLREVGVGYYPNSQFVHVDVRDRSAYWVDVSRPGEQPRYRDPNDALVADGEGGEGAEVDEASEVESDAGDESTIAETATAELAGGDDEGGDEGEAD
jgi:uncharacterized protein YcbK (DUF882 family)